MPRRYTPQGVVKVLESLGWVIVRQDGDHLRMRKPDGAYATTVWLKAKEVPAPILASILGQTGLRRREFDRRADEVL